MPSALLEIDDYVAASVERQGIHPRHPDLRSKEVKEAVQQRARRDYERYLEKARSGNGAAFRALCSVMMDIYMREEIFGMKKFVPPEDWRSLVTRYIDNPSLEEYWYSDNVKDGFARNYAANALVERSLHMVKVALAYGNRFTLRSVGGRYDHHFRIEIGEILMTDLVKLKVELEKEQGISYK